MNNKKMIDEIRATLSMCKNNAQRLAVLNELRQNLVDEIASEKGFDVETLKGLNLAQTHAMRRFPELWSQSLIG